jgi:menaquinone-dependent protoporphyrinogen IX oxidase
MPKALLVYHTFTKQTGLVADVMADTFRSRGYEVEQAPIEFTDKRYVKRFSHLPSFRALIDIGLMLIPQARKKTGEIGVPDVAKQAGYDLVVVGSPTWWLTTSVPVRSFLKSDDGKTVLDGTPFASYVVCRRYWNWNLKSVRSLGEAQRGIWLDGTKFTAEGGQVRSMAALLSYVWHGEYRDRFFGIKIPHANLKDGFDADARSFANALADRLETGSIAS